VTEVAANLPTFVTRGQRVRSRWCRLLLYRVTLPNRLDRREGTKALATPPAWPALEKGEGRPVVFLHGYPLNHVMWRPQIEAVSEQNHVVLLDLPGFGLAETSPVPDSLAGFAEKVHRFVTSHLPGPVVVVAHSFGGYVALHLVRDHPEMFAGLVLTNTRSSADSAEAKEKRLATVRRLEDSPQGLDLEMTARSLLAPGAWDRGGPLIETVRSMVRSARSPALRGALSAMANRPDLTPVLSTIPVPTLVVWGEEDQLIPPSQSQSMLPHLSKGVGVGIPGAGHLPSLETPGLFGRALTEFLARVPAT
jgi:3-oxoadipate enol-lactonase